MAGGLTRTLGNPVTLVLGLVGGLAFALASATIAFTDRFDSLFPLASLLGIWGVVVGVMVLLRRSDPGSLAVDHPGRVITACSGLRPRRPDAVQFPGFGLGHSNYPTSSQGVCQVRHERGSARPDIGSCDRRHDRADRGYERAVRVRRGELATKRMGKLRSQISPPNECGGHRTPTSRESRLSARLAPYCGAPHGPDQLVARLAGEGRT